MTNDTRQALKNSLPIFSGLVLMITGYGLFQTFIALRFEQEGFSKLLIGLQSSAFFAGMIIGTFYGAKLIESIGRIRAYAALCGLASVSILLMPLIPYLPLWIFLRLLLGFCVAGQYIVTESWINTSATATNRGLIIALYIMITNIGYGGGQMLLNVADINSDTFFIIAALFMAAALIPVAITKVSSPETIDTSYFNVKKLFKISPVAVTGCFLCGVLIMSSFSMSPVYLNDSGFSIAKLSVFIALLSVGGLFTQIPVGRLSDRMDRRLVLLGVNLVIVMITIPLLFISTPSAMVLLVFAAVYGGASQTIYPLCIAHANDHVDASEMVQASSGMVLSYSIGSAIGPTLTGTLMELFGNQMLFIVIISISAFLVLYIFYRTRRREAVEQEDKEAYVPLPDAMHTPGGADIDPRSECLEDSDCEEENTATKNQPAT